MELYNYKAEVLKIIDGDTANLNIDMGIKIYFKSNCRLSGINAPELKSLDPEIKEKAILSKEYLAKLLKVGSIVEINSKKLDKYGRPIVLIISNKVNINDEMLKSGNAIVY